MSLSFCSFSSGSSGNQYLVRCSDTAVLADAGISAARTLACLESCGTAPSDVSALFVTHEHSDHCSGAGSLMRKIPGMKIACSEGTFLSMRARSYPDRFIQAKSGEPMQIGRITAIPLTLSHDVGDPVGFSFAAEGGQVTIITDTGTYTQEMLDHAAKSDILVIEANHDVAMLKNGRYPPFLKQRIISDKGHLSNAQTARFIIEAMEIDPKPRCILLAHLSADNNTPAIAMKTVSDALAKEGLYSGKDLYLSVLERDKISPIYQI